MGEIEIIQRLLFAAFLGGIIGYERESVHKPAGLRTHIFVSMGSALFTIIAVFIPQYISYISTTNYDPSRIISAILTGIGFIGAGVIFHRSDHHIEGITTAAGLWVAAGIGITVGLGVYITAVSVVVISLASLMGLERLRPK